jgi:hypothetical protein
LFCTIDELRLVDCSWEFVVRCSEFSVHSYSPTGVYAAPPLLALFARLMRKKGLAVGGQCS